MEDQQFKKLEDADGLYNNAEPLKHKVVEPLKSEMEIKIIMCNVVRVLVVTLEEIKEKAKKDVFIAEIKKQLWKKKLRQNQELNAYSICDGVVWKKARNTESVTGTYIEGFFISDILAFQEGNPRNFACWFGMNLDIERKTVKAYRWSSLATIISQWNILAKDKFSVVKM